MRKYLWPLVVVGNKYGVDLENSRLAGDFFIAFALTARDLDGVGYSFG